MVFGVGTDIVQSSRVEKIWQRFGERFADRLLLSEERALFDVSKRPVRFLSMRFAIKEAVVKAMGTGFAHGMWIRDVGMVPVRAPRYRRGARFRDGRSRPCRRDRRINACGRPGQLM